MQTIPRIIHQTWKNEIIPQESKGATESWRNNHPGWKYILWTDAMNRDLINNHFPWFLEKYDNYKYNIQRADAIRYFILWKYGGVYADIDVVSQKPLDPLVLDMEHKKQTLALVQGSHLNHVSNWLMISSQYHLLWPLVWYVMLKEKCTLCIGKHFTVMYSTGPLMLNNTVKKHNVVHRKLSRGFNECNMCNRNTCSCRSCYVLNLNQGSWNGWDSILYNKCYCYRKQLLMILLAIIIMICIFIK